MSFMTSEEGKACITHICILLIMCVYNVYVCIYTYIYIYMYIYMYIFVYIYGLKLKHHTRHSTK